MLDGDIAVAIAALLVSGPVKDSVEPLAQVDIVRGGAEAGLGGDQGIQLLAQDRQIHAGLDQDSPRQPLLPQQGSKQMLALHVLLALLLRQLLGGHHGAPGLFGELLSGGMHGAPGGVGSRWHNRMEPIRRRLP